MYAVFNGMQQILLPSQVAAIDPDGRIGSYGLLATAGALIAAVANPLFGSMSDRTRSRFGRRTPWIVSSASIALLGLVLMGGMTHLFWLGAAYVLVMLSMGAYQAVIAALMPDRVPESRRGLVSSIAGLATTIGVIFGINAAPAFVANPIAGYALLGTVLVTAAVTMSVLAPDPTISDGSTAEPPATRRSLRTFFAGLADHEFAWAFWARVVIMAGFWTVSTYQLYTPTDFIGVDDIPGGDAGTGVAILGTINLGCGLVTTLISGPLSDRLGKRKLFVVVASLGIAAGTLIPVFAPTWAGMVAYSIVVGTFFGAYLAVDQAIMTLVLPRSEDNARDLGLLNIATTAPQVAAPLVAGVIITITGGYVALFVFAALAAVIGAFAITPIRRVN
ncbi:MFS transporter [Microbacterium kyungheense]|uniref:MFS-type transporter involved in bile tolerance (Atg22 family) n=1 Tax=Microbacterium kyungheense TaxID=1263636 RepID=A0A543EUE8_9MICO|nr:MFS transporter [Microbacterium kyungheense]TQM25200.1 MFS-type transporter involved in bile tolerance (Atg22 family) [Microbacterium kyungheense]